MKTFRTYCIVTHQEAEKVIHLYINGHPFKFLPEPTGQFWQNKSGKLRMRHVDKANYANPKQDDLPQLEMLVTANDEAEASGIVSTLAAGMLLAFPSPGDLEIHLEEQSGNFNEAVYKEKWYQNRFEQMDHLDFGHLVLHAAKGDKILLYALEKYKLSIQLSSFHPHYGSPRYGNLFTHYESNTEYHTKAAFAIISAFSAIEELGLEIRSSAQKPRFLDNETGHWNPVVLNNLNERLTTAGIKHQEKIDWIYRGDPSAVEKSFKPYFGIDSEWVNGKDVRDKSLTYPEAIHNASYLRNFVTAHKFNNLTAFISPYDVFNVQNLVRSIILTRLGLWETLRQRQH